MTSSSASEPADGPAGIALRGMGLRFRVYRDTGMSLKRRFISWVTRTGQAEISERWLFRGLDLDIAHGERVGIVGRNGAGKSTLLKVISGVYAPTAGCIEVAGRIAPMLELGTGFQADYPAPENILLNGAMLGISRARMLERTDAILAFAELQEHRRLPIKYFSSGMVMRLAFSIAMEVEPQILLIDEIFAGGDLGFVDKARKRLLGLIDSAHIMVMVSHDLALLRGLVQRCIWIEDGSVRADGSPDQVLAAYAGFMRQGVPSGE